MLSSLEGEGGWRGRFVVGEGVSLEGREVRCWGGRFVVGEGGSLMGREVR